MTSRGIAAAIKNSMKDPAAKRRLSAVTMGCAVLMAVSIVRGAEAGGRYVVNGEDELVAICREDTERAEDFSVEVKLGDGAEERRSITLAPSARDSPEDGQSVSGLDEELYRSAELDMLIGQIEASGERKVELPTALSDGTEVRWRKAKHGDTTWLYILLLYLALVPVTAAGAGDPKQRQLSEARAGIVRRVPRFINQLLLLMNAGLILNDSFRQICACYELVPEDRRSLFEVELIELNRGNSDNLRGTAAMIAEIANKYNVKELMRISAFMSDNEKKGSDIIESLSRESRYLWDERKVIATEKGKMADTRMAYPLGLLLILLIVITMAPALLGM